MGDVLLAADRWPTNADLIADVLAMYAPDGAARAADVTWGRGNWWTRIHPNDCVPEGVERVFVMHDLRLDGVDFRNLPEPDGSFDLVAFDPPYVCTGGRKTSTLASKKAPEAAVDDQPADFLDRYGLADAPTTPEGVQQLINDGLTEVHRVLAVDGLALVKCKDYIWSGRLFPGTHHTLTHALRLGFELVDRFEHIGSPGPQPSTTKCKGCDGTGLLGIVNEHDEVVDMPDCTACGGTGKVARRAQHARRNLSTLFVFRKTKRTRITTPPPPPPPPATTTEAP